MALPSNLIRRVAKYDSEEEVEVEKGARGIIEGRGKKARLYVVFAIKAKLEGKEMEKTAKTSHGKLLTIWRAFGDLVASKAVGKEKGGNAMAGLLSFSLRALSSQFNLTNL